MYVCTSNVQQLFKISGDFTSNRVCVCNVWVRNLISYFFLFRFGCATSDIGAVPMDEIACVK